LGTREDAKVGHDLLWYSTAIANVVERVEPVARVARDLSRVEPKICEGRDVLPLVAEKMDSAARNTDTQITIPFADRFDSHMLISITLPNDKGRHDVGAG
jgi:hypothetical protein